MMSPVSLQLKQASKRPQDYLKEMPPMPNFKLEVCSSEPPTEHSRFWLTVGAVSQHGQMLVYSPWHILLCSTSLLHDLGKTSS